MSDDGRVSRREQIRWIRTEMQSSRGRHNRADAAERACRERRREGEILLLFDLALVLMRDLRHRCLLLQGRSTLASTPFVLLVELRLFGECRETVDGRELILRRRRRQACLLLGIRRIRARATFVLDRRVWRRLVVRRRNFRRTMKRRECDATRTTAVEVGRDTTRTGTRAGARRTRE